MTDILLQIAAFLITILALVSVHEAGHFFVARALGIKVLRFSIGFGRPLYKRTSKAGIEYVIAMLPLGGYVKMLDERECVVPDAEKHQAFNRQPLWSRALVVIAGPAINIVFAILAYWAIFAIGFQATKPVIHSIEPNTPAAMAGVPAGATLVAIDGQAVQTWEDSVFAMIWRMGDTGKMAVQVQPSDGAGASSYQLDLSQWHLNPLRPSPLRSLGMLPYAPELPAVFDQVSPGGPADQAGLKAGDKVLQLDDTPIQSWQDFVEYIQQHPGQTVQVRYLRDGQTAQLPVTVGTKHVLVGFRRIGVIGVMVKPTDLPESLKMMVQYPVLGAIVPATQETWRFFSFNIHVLKKMLLGEISLRSLGGPITIFKTANVAFRQGVVKFLRFLAMISIMLAFVNILPIPGLDGGHLLLFFIELVKRGPLSLRGELFAMRMGMSALLLLMIAATFNDIMRIFQ